MVINAANDHKVVYYDCKRIKHIYIVNKNITRIFTYKNTLKLTMMAKVEYNIDYQTRIVL